MGKQRLNPRLVKIHYSYTVGEIASLYGVHKNTVRRWIKEGLSTTNDNRRPVLILGRELHDFLCKKRQKHACTCKPGEIYCVGCRKAQRPAEDMVDYQVINEKQGNLIGLCPSCGHIINRRIEVDLIHWTEIL